ncbi:Olfactory receptor 15 [Heterocephalus glaber]|uniref:Olfactory receptor n=1 Tax=Heterocephalus glaber TaxID=10181 RepID=G5C2J6_HETGA|nr:Olfactory receptor 15 [Heterocephalus glaber]
MIPIPVSHILETDAMEINASFPNTFILLGFSEFPWLERPLFAVVLVCYLLTLVGNSSIILLSLLDPRLQMPMYFFLDNLSLLDLCISCTVLPQLLVNLWGPDKTIAAWGCITQVYLFSWTGCTECILLTMMAVDRYVAICRPLQYTLIMRPWLPICGPHNLDHFFCEVPVLIKVACGETTVNELALALGAIPFAGMAPLLVLISFTFISRAILKLPSAEGRHKALSTCSSHLVVITLYPRHCTCSSHLLVVTMYFGPAIYMYLQPPAKSTQAKFMSFFYCIITPVLNPLIYTLRNKDVETAWKRILQSLGQVKSWKVRRSLPVS